VPRTRPRREQVMRATRAAEHGLARILDPEGPHDPALMTRALHELPEQPLPSLSGTQEMLDGLDVITSLVADRVGRPAVPQRVLARAG